jgi:hypothetical protein
MQAFGLGDTGDRVHLTVLSESDGMPPALLGWESKNELEITSEKLLSKYTLIDAKK